MYTSYIEIFLTLCILMLPFFYECSQVFRFYLKFLLYYVIVSFNAIILTPLFLFKARDVRNLVTASTFCSPISSLIGMKWILRGREHLEKDESFIIVSNHQSSLDVLGMFDIWAIMDKCTVVAKKELFYAWPFGLASWLAGLIFIDRMNSEKARKTLQDAAESIKAKRIKLWIFPEGHRRNTGELHPFKKGAFHLAISAQLPVLPVVYSRYYFLDEDNKRFDHGKVMITALPPISTQGMTSNDVDKLIEQTREVMIKTFHETSKQVAASHQVTQ
ncbi:Acyltransferase [Popillia japonica]|uniref:1-acyl-sn-glycerol-3-phosphate acyltransferase n=1 Tax=Popillia japonica TaxID=7064 RepID=A0AAW1MMD4_POPJA